MIEKGKLTRLQLDRVAYVYVRQSTVHQVRDHQESTKQQYKLVSTARELGFRDVIVIDDDLGVTGSGTAERPGFGRLLTAICEGKVGAVVAMDSSRFARNGHDWYRMIELCRLTNAFIINPEGIYDPGDNSDRLMLGVMGTLSEFETGQLQRRALGALLEKAKRGEVYTRLPVGYVRTEDGRCEKTPDRQVQAAIEGMFAKFDELGSARQVALWYQNEEIPFPKVKVIRGQSSVRWRLPEARYILSILKNPRYAGAYVWGRYQTRTKVVDGREQKTSGHLAPREEWQVLIQDHHPAYISWERYEANQEKLANNTLRWGEMGTGAARSGEALLGGLLRCGRCWHKLRVNYKSAKSAGYQCRSYAPDHCAYSFSSRNVDEAVCSEVLRAVQPAGATAAMQALARLSQHNEEEILQLSLAVENARYQADRYRRQYNAVEPENRLVAATLEGQWNNALNELQCLENRLEQLKEARIEIPPDESQRLLKLGDDLEAVWYHPKAKPELKKRILRTVLEEIIVEVRDDPPEILLHLHWAGGVHTELRVPRLRSGEHRNTTPQQVVTMIQDLAKVCDDETIASVLNRSRIKTGKGGRWSASRVQKLRSRRKIPAFKPSKPRLWVNLSEAAKELGISPPTVRSLIKQGVLPGHQVIQYAPWIIERSDLELPEVIAAVRSISQGIPRKQSPETQPSLFSTVDPKGAL
jgi:DNA invertase Pin-like site-specific DNA recombinase